MLKRPFGSAFLGTFLLLTLNACDGDNSTGNGGGGSGGTGASTAGAAGHGGQGGSGGGQGGAVIPTEHPRIYLNDANKTRLSAALSSSTQAASRFRDMVDGHMMNGNVYAFEPYFAALLGALTGDAAYCTYAVDEVDVHVASEEALINMGERAEVAFDSYLYVGDVIGDLSLVYDWCYDTLTADQKTRWVTYANQAVWNVWNPDDAVWGGVSYPWSGWSIDNPSNNYYYSFLRATMLLGLATSGENDQAQTWVDRFRKDKIEGQLVPTFESDLKGGGSREGTGYGVAMMSLFHLYDLWESSTGERIWDLTGHTRASLPNILHFTVPTLDRIAPIGDHARDSTAALFDYHRMYVLVLAHLLGKNDALSDVAQTWLDSCSVPEMGQPFMYIHDFLYYDESHAKRPLSDLHPSYYASGTGSIFFRNSWETSASWGAFIAGPFTESHAHRDQGSLLVYQNEWLGDDQNIFSHSGIYQNEEAHNLVRIEDGGTTVTQINGGSTLAALHDTADFLYIRANITPIYNNHPAISAVGREVLFLKGPGAHIVMDRVDTSPSAEAVWQLNSPIAASNATSGWNIVGGQNTLAVRTLYPSNPGSQVLNWMSLDSDMEGGFRLDVTHPNANGKARFLMVLAPGNNITSTAPSAAGGTIGGTVNFADGTVAEVAFSADSPGGTLKLTTGGSVVFDGQLPSTVSDLPLFDVAP
ncbi:MAG: hypothetical protein IPK82_09720 [Polyangiaceae bacterium]|nr:hypothetical protein [Polyangiaceae bacterium]